MNRRLLFLPVAALVVFAGYLGWRAGQPVTETEIIESFAARYVAATGGEATDCYARPGNREGVRMIVICERGESAMRWFVNAQGREIVPGGPEA